MNYRGSFFPDAQIFALTMAFAQEQYDGETKM
jgi:hypothetical protein